MNHQPNTPASLNEAVALIADILAQDDKLCRALGLAKIESRSDSAHQDWKAMQKTWDNLMNRARSMIAASGAAIDAREQEASVPPGDTFAYRLQELKRILKAPSPVAIQVCSRSFLRELIGRLDLTPSEALSPATVAQPVVPAESRKSAKAAAEYEVGEWMGENDVVLKIPAYRNLIALVLAAQSAAQPCASQGCGGAVSEAGRNLLRAVDAEMSEGWTCNSYHPSLKPAAEQLRAALSTDKSGGADHA